MAARDGPIVKSQQRFQSLFDSLLGMELGGIVRPFTIEHPPKTLTNRFLLWPSSQSPDRGYLS
jgi:hypothetical protein